MLPMGKMLVVFGVIVAGVGFLLIFFDKIPFLGKLPGDILIKRENFRFFFPITSSIILSLIVSAAVWLFSYFKEH